jgi:thiamine biosynthesis lipoprotein
MRQAEQIMGMPITIDIPVHSSEDVFKKVFARFNEIDKRFSPYKKDSELCKYQRGEILENELSVEFKKVMQSCKDASKMTGGNFTAYYAGKYDPSGYVKGWAIAEAGKLIEKNGYKTYCISAGGDILARSNSEKIWNIGIQDPRDKTKILISVKDSLLDLSGEAAKISSSRKRYTLSNKPIILSIKNGAVATSGNYERGNHIINPMTGEYADEFLSVTVVGPEIIKADVFATAVFAAGVFGLTMIEDNKNYNALAIDKNNDFYMTSNMEKLL